MDPGIHTSLSTLLKVISVPYARRHPGRVLTILLSVSLGVAGMVATGNSPSGNLVEIVELENHPWFVAVQFHPEFQSKPADPHPLFRGFMKAALEYHRERIKISV